jgi:hypothetical protein
MARRGHPFIRLQGTIAGITHVNSRTYGDHPRLPRGTHKKARLNESLRKNAEAAPQVSQTASPLHRQIKACYGSFVPGSLWQRMTSRMFKASFTSLQHLSVYLKGVEINERYALSRLLAAQPVIKASCTKKKLRIDMEMQGHCVFPKAVKEDGYYYELTLLWLNDKAGRCEPAVLETEWLKAKDPLPRYELVFEKPAWAGHYVLLLRVQAGRGLRPVDSFAAMAVQIVESGVC